MLNPKDVTLKDKHGNEHEFVLTEPPATVARELLLKYPVANTMKLEQFDVSQATMLKLMSYVGKRDANGDVIMLKTADLVNNHAPCAVLLFKLEALMLEHMSGFFALVRSPDFLAGLIAKIPQPLMQTATRFLQQLSANASQPGQNSEKN